MRREVAVVIAHALKVCPQQAEVLGLFRGHLQPVKVVGIGHVRKTPDGIKREVDGVEFDVPLKLYGDATSALIKMQLASKAHDLPPYDEALLTREMQLFPDWYVAKHLNFELNSEQQCWLQQAFDALNKNILAQGQVTVHRDYHSRNLMIFQGVNGHNPGILDFQDAVYGPITYDLVSLLKDAYIQWDEEQIIDWAVRYWQPAKKAGLPVPDDFSEFYRDFEWMGAQRHIKVLGIFARLSHRDGKDGYLKDMPLVMHYLRKVCERYVELRPMLRLLDALEGRVPRPKYVV